MRRDSWKRLLPQFRRWQVASVLGGLLLLGVIGYVTRPNWRPEALPSPNGYLLFVEAGGRIVGELADPVAADLPALHAFVDPNRKVLRELRDAVGLLSRIPLGENQQRTLERMNAEDVLIRKLGRLGIAAGTLAEAEGRIPEALWAYTDVARMGKNAAFGGLVTNEMAGQSVRRQGLEAVDRLREKLDAGQCRLLIDLLKNLDTNIDSPAEVISRDQAWFLATSPWYIQAQIRWKPGVRASMRKLVQPAYRAFESASERDVLRIRRQLVLTAARLRRLETGVDVLKLEELVPRYLPAVPRDPASGYLLRLPTEDGPGPFIEDRSTHGDTPASTTAP